MHNSISIKKARMMMQKILAICPEHPLYALSHQCFQEWILHYAVSQTGQENCTVLSLQGFMPLVGAEASIVPPNKF
jgi:hypothetical protein